MVTAQAPGKLYIAGEYAVVETGRPAIIVALNQFVTVSVEEMPEYGSIVSKQYSENSLVWSRDGDKMVFDNRDNPFHYILSAIRLVEAYAKQQGVKLGLYRLAVDSDLDSESGKKFGLGSSAAVTVATVKALNAYYELNLGQDALYKLASIAHLDVQGNGSLGDIAASVYGGWIAYRSFDKEWLTLMRRSHSLSELIDLEWPQLEIELLQPPAELSLMIGWTGSPASTSQLVDKIAIAKAEKPAAYATFLDSAERVIVAMINGFRNADLAAIQEGVRDYRTLLDHLANFSGVEIATRRLRDLIDVAEIYGGAGKTSGAGGGDCGIVIADNRLDREALINAWVKRSVLWLDLRVHEISARA